VAQRPISQVATFQTSKAYAPADLFCSYRAIGVRENDQVTWVWIGAHDEYDRLLK
jgi:hypothetical protein